MKKEITGWAAWHPEKGFDGYTYEGPIVYADLHPSLIDEVKELNEEDGTNNKYGWRAVRVKVVKE